ncbi:MAG: hypothetical protein HJJLKODD_02650 [Phycisphaerae bacterium]|nr:hypothetical protein [Phycisphaerae bacterium]
MLRAASIFWMIPLGMSTGLICLAADLPGRDTAPVDEVDRIIKHFDFDERKLGNLEEIPMHWQRYQADGFPEFSAGKFDDQQGYTGAPSFYLSLDGRSCAYYYDRADIVVEPDSNYRIVARIRPDKLFHARAYLSAYYLDAAGNVLANTIRFSEMVGGSGQDDAWQEVTIQLPNQTDTSYAIGLKVWVVQPSIWWSGPRPYKHIEQKDIYGGAWFDDLIIYRLPRIELTSSAADRGHLFRAGESPVLLAHVGGMDQHDRDVRLRVHDVIGRVVFEQSLADIQSDDRHSQQVSLSNLPPGYYHARLTVDIHDGTVIDRRLGFVCQGSPPPPPLAKTSPQRLGLMIRSNTPRNWPVLQELVEILQIHHLKLPISSNHFEQDEAHLRAQDQFIQNLADQGVQMTGVLVKSDAETALDSTASGSVIDLLSLSTEIWQPFLAQMITRYESRFRYWQLGFDGHDAVINDSRLKSSLQNFRQEIGKLVATPLIAYPWSVQHDQPDKELTADTVSVTVPVTVAPTEIVNYLNDAAQHFQPAQLWAVLETLPADQFRQLPMLADTAKRLIYALQSKAEIVFLPEPWRFRNNAGQVYAEPDNELSAYQILISCLDQARYLGSLTLHPDVQCEAFDVNGQALLILWADGAPLNGEEFTLELGGATQLTDLWGQHQSLTIEQGFSKMRLSPLPVIASYAPSWLIDFRRHLRFDPELLPSESVSHEQTLVIKNPRMDPISGTIKLRAPVGWQIRPSQLSFALQPGAEDRPLIRIQSAAREPAGAKQIEAQVTIDAEQLITFETMLPLQLDLADIDVAADLLLEGDLLVVRHHITNHSPETLTFRSFADAPGRRRQNLYIIDLQPGQSVVKSHVFPEAHSLSGQLIRLGLKQKKGPRVHEASITVP